MIESQDYYADDGYQPQAYGMQGLPNPMMGSQSVNQDPNFMKWLFDFRDKVVGPLKYIWRGWEYDEDRKVWFLPYVMTTDGKKWINPATGRPQPKNKPIMNEKGITWAISLIESYINPVFIVSNYDQRHMNYIMRQTMTNVIKNLYYRYKEFDLHKLDIERVRMEIESKIQAILLGALGDGYRDFFAKQHHTNENINNYPQQQGQGLLAGIAGIFKKNQGQARA